jgi:hypothetical protein
VKDLEEYISNKEIFRLLSSVVAVVGVEKMHEILEHYESNRKILKEMQLKDEL